MNDQPSPEVMAQAKAAGLRRGDSFSYSNDTPVTRPDLDALMADLRRNLRLYADPAADLIARSLTALAAERARADQAEGDVKRYEDRARENRELLDQFAARVDQATAVLAEMSDDDDEYPLEALWKARLMRALSAAPTAEQGTES
jgi:hypothetical protein